MAVELAIVTPVILVILIIIFDMLVFTSECARFDNLAPQQVIAHGTSDSSEEDDESSTLKIQSFLEAEFNENGSWVEVEQLDRGVPFANIKTFQCTFHFVPWPLALSGAPANLEHSCSLTVDSYEPGKFL